MTTTKKANASNLTKQLAVESAERQVMEAARRMARRNGAVKMAQLLGLKP